jgi:hypothetical protein
VEEVRELQHAQDGDESVRRELGPVGDRRLHGKPGGSYDSVVGTFGARPTPDLK